MAEEEQETKEEVQKVEQGINQSQVQMFDKETQDGGSTKKEEERTGCISRGFRIHRLKGDD